MIVGSVCISHSPLMEANRAQASVESRFEAALSAANNYVDGLAPDVTVVFYPDHLNGFLYDLLPPFCVGIEGVSIGDYGTRAGKLDIPQDLAMDLATTLQAKDFDVAISYRMEVDHGASQPIELLSAKRDISRIIPVFINCAAHPRPSFRRVQMLGRAVGDWAREQSERILVIGQYLDQIEELAEALDVAADRRDVGPVDQRNEGAGRDLQILELLHIVQVGRVGEHRANAAATGQRQGAVRQQLGLAVLGGMGHGDYDVVGTGHQIHGTAHAFVEFTGNHPAGDVACHVHFKRT